MFEKRKIDTDNIDELLSDFINYEEVGELL